MPRVSLSVRRMVVALSAGAWAALWSAAAAWSDDPRWAFEPVAAPPLPAVAQPGWCHTAIDRFLLAHIESQGLAPSEPAEPAALFRRVTLDLVGLPPSPDEAQAFVADDSPEALAKVVDRLLASPHYGERWGRHWLDVVRYADSDGHEFDPDKPHAWRYRDYVIEAFNADVPYNQFVAEHIAGDLLPRPRLSADSRSAISPLGTTFWWLGEVQGAPVDPAMAAANLREQQLDVFGRAILGLTVACARCHEHKFDPISREDYYALCGFLESTRPAQRALDAGGQQAEVRRRLNELAEVQRQLQTLLQPARQAYALAALSELREALLQSIGADDLTEAGRARPELSRWLNEIAAAEDSPQHPLYFWARLRRYGAPDGQFSKRRRALADRLAQAAQRQEADARQVFASFELDEPWEAIGPAFADRADASETEARLGEGDGCASSAVADVLTGRLISPTFVIEKRYLGYLIAGPPRPGKTCVNVLINGQSMPEMQRTGKGAQFTWVTVDVSTMRGREARLELVDDDASPGGFVAVDHVCFSDEEPAAPGAYRHVLVQSLLADDQLDSPQKLADALVALLEQAVRLSPREATSAAADQMAEWTAWRRWLLFASPLASDFAARQAALVADPDGLIRLQSQRQALLSGWPSATLGLVATDGAGRDATLQEGGLADAQHRGPPVPRRFLAAVAGEAPLPISQGSGRLELAAVVASPSNPLLARVIVNRLWQHHFGQGIVATSDNFGDLGERPTHPELLDHLATQLVQAGWSLKALHKSMLLSRAYAQATRGSDTAHAHDPLNRWLARMSPKRLEAECVRDAALTLAGRLDTTVGGPGVPMYLEPWMHGRDRPQTQGPLDGAGRRSVYLEIRRNFPAPLLTALDFPRPQTTVGRRQNSQSPVQPLSLMNDAHLRQLAAAWADRLTKAEPQPRRRIERMFWEALSRPATAAEIAAVERYLQAHPRDGSQASGSSLGGWTGACLAVVNADEFIVAP